MKVVGRRSLNGEGLADQGRLARTAALLRGTPWLVPCGVYRFSTFEEAEEWMRNETRRTRERLSRTTSSRSAER